MTELAKTQIASFAEATGQWHKGFRVWFGGTYYLVDFANPSEAEAAVAATWRRWLQTAREKLLKAPNAQDHV